LMNRSRQRRRRFGKGTRRLPSPESASASRLFRARL
jgi:hypothetical protein